jgi:CheY-like chemotaxis protein
MRWTVHATTPLTILVADDEPMIVRAVSRLLERAGHNVHAARDADQALELLETHRFQVAFIDHHMPGGGGARVLEAIERQPEWNGLAVLMTGDEIQSPDLPGGDRVHRLQKPFQFQEVTALIALAGEGAAATEVAAEVAPTPSDTSAEPPDIGPVSPLALPELLVRAGWLTVADRLMLGITHDLSGRVTSLSGMVQLLGLDKEASGTAPFLPDEVRRLGASVQLVALLTGEVGGEPELLDLEALLRPLLDLHRRHGGLEAVESVLEISGTPRVQADRALLTRTALLVLAHGGQAALERDRRLDVWAGARSTDGASMRVVASGTRSREGALEAPTRPDALQQLARRLGARLTVEDTREGLRLEVRFPPPRRERR